MLIALRVHQGATVEAAVVPVGLEDLGQVGELAPQVPPLVTKGKVILPGEIMTEFPPGYPQLTEQSLAGGPTMTMMMSEWCCLASSTMAQISAGEESRQS